MSRESSTRVYPVPVAESVGDSPLGERTNQHPGPGARPVAARAEIPLHRGSPCSGLCGLSSREPEEYATVYVTSQTDIARILQVPLQPPPSHCVFCIGCHVLEQELDSGVWNVWWRNVDRMVSRSRQLYRKMNVTTGARRPAGRIGGAVVPTHF